MKKFIIFGIIACVVIGIIAFAWNAGVGSRGPVLKLSKADEVICELEGNQFVKINDGAAWVGLLHNEKGAIVPILISEDKDAVSYIEVSTGKVTEAVYTPLELGSKQYYYAYGNHIERYVEGWQSKDNLPIYYTDSNEPVRDVLSSRNAQNDGGWLKHIVKNYWYVPIIIFALIILIIKVKPFYSSGNNDDDFSSGGGSSSGMSSEDINRILDDIDESRIMDKITHNINTPGYDADSFGPPSDV